MSILIIAIRLTLIRTQTIFEIKWTQKEDFLKSR